MIETEAAAPTILQANQVDSDRLDAFLRRFLGQAKGDFLGRYGDWWHGGPENRWVVMVGNDVAGYCAIIPTVILVKGQETQALWWVDLMVDPQYRGQGLQTLFDDKIRAVADLKLGFPNELAAKIHRKHGWGVHESLEVLLLPFRPLRIKRVRRARGLRGIGLRMGAVAVAPLFAAIRWSIVRYRPKQARRMADPTPEGLSEIFLRTKNDRITTTLRNAAYLQWRFFDAPYTSDLKYYAAGPVDQPEQVLVTRDTNFGGIRATRILDFFGDVENRAATRDLFLCAMQDMIRTGSTQVIVLTSGLAPAEVLRRLGFVISSMARFCWYSEDASVMADLQDPGFWTLADSDNDAPD